MKKWITVLLCISLIVLSGCSQKYQRISFDQEVLGEELQRLSPDAEVDNQAKETFSTPIPIFQISEREITAAEVQQMMQLLEIDTESPNLTVTLDRNTLVGTLASFTDRSRGYVTKTDAELEEMAWEIFKKLPFMEGEYECLGVRSSYTLSDSTGLHILRAGVVFQPLLDGMRVVGNEQCILEFDGSGFVGFSIARYTYTKIGTMDVIPLENASSRILNPDVFTVETGEGKPSLGQIDTLTVERVKLLLVNQYSHGCTILQPLYNFIGTATDDKGESTEFQSRVIAIPDSYTYEKE